MTKTLRAIACLLLPLTLWGARGGRAAQSAERLLETGLDAQECYRVQDLNLTKEDLRIFLGDGYLIFGKPLDGAPVAAVFWAEIEGGDGELMLFPPSRAERMSLASFAGSPNLNERFRNGVFLFTDDTYQRAMAQIRKKECKKAPEIGQTLQQTWEPVVRNLSSSFQIRMVKDLLTGGRPSRGFLYAALGNRRLGNFDLMYDSTSNLQITVGQVAMRNNGTFFDIWTRFPSRSYREKTREVPPPEMKLQSIKIDATLDPDLTLRATSKLTFTANVDVPGALSLEISPRMRLSDAKLDGQPVDLFQPESMRANLIKGGTDAIFLVVLPSDLKRGEKHELEFRHEGEVITDAGNRVYYVGSRGSWYPHPGLQFASYDVTFRYPVDLNLVACGQVTEDRKEGPLHITRRLTGTPIRMYGFNLGDYEHQTSARGDLNVEVYANRQVERALDSSRTLVVVPPLRVPDPRRAGGEVFMAPLESRPDPTYRLQRMAGEIANAFEFMNRNFGPPPVKTLTVSPIPGAFGQGFPGLLYLSTLAYLEPRERAGTARSLYQQEFFTDLLHAHETAHQWWGNIVITDEEQDYWILEALADYSALMYLERRKGSAALETILGEYKKDLLEKRENSDNTIESSGPIIWGTRLISSQAPTAWRIITYEKGAWVFHMLRRQMGDDRFLTMLAELRKAYEYRAVSTQQLRELAARFLPPKSPDPTLESFFEQWVYGTGIPSLKFSQTVQKKGAVVRVRGTITQSDVDEDFSATVPVQMFFAKGKPVTEWVRTGNGAIPFSFAVPEAPTRVVFDAGSSVLRR